MSEIFLHESGPAEAPAIVFLHGVGSTGAMWRTHMASLPEYHCLAPDLPGFGRSQGEGWGTRAATAEQVASLIESRVPAGRAHVVGLSLGASLAFELLRRRPELIDRVIIDGCAAIPTAAALPMKAGVAVLSPFLRWAWVARLVGRAFGVKDGPNLADFVSQMTQASPGSFRRAFAQAQDVRITRELLQAESPTLLVAGEHELKSTRASNRLLAEHMPHAVSRTVPDAGHGWISTAPELHLRMVRAWLGDQPLPAELQAEDQLPDAPISTLLGRPVHEEITSMNHNLRIGMAALYAGVALLAAIASALGVFARGDGTFETVISERGVPYEMATTGVYAFNAQRVVAEGIGWDIFTLLIAVPALLVAAILVARGSFRGRLFAAGLLGYFLYQYLEYAVTWAFGPLFLLFIVIYAASLAGIVWIGVSVVREGVAGRFGERFPRRSWAILNIAMAAMLTLLWVQRIATALGGNLLVGGLTSETTMTVQALDLGLVVPTSVFIAVLAWRRTAAGYALATAYSVTFVAMAAAIVSMLLAAWAVEGSLELPPIAIFGLAAAAAVAIGLRIYRSVIPVAHSSPPTAARTAPVAA